MDNTKSLTFVIPDTEMFLQTLEIFMPKCDQETLEKLSNHYVLLRRESDDDNITCSMMDILESDVLNSVGSSTATYKLLVSSFGKSKVDLFIHKEEQDIRDKVLSAILLAFKSSNTDRLQIRYSMADSHDTVTLVDELIRKNFTVISESFLGDTNKFSIVITNRKELKYDER